MAMFLGALVVFVVFVGISRGDESMDSFPENFIWGAGTTAYTSEGAWNEDGKSPSIWDWVSHDPGNPIMNHTLSDVACDSYHTYKEDVELLKHLGVSHYRFSIAWSRIIPNPITGAVNAKGVDFYNRLIDALLEAGIKPMVILYYFDLPQILQERYGGWVNDIIVDKFGEYADVVFRSFGDRVKHFLTIKEGIVEAVWGYGFGNLAPGMHDEEAMYKAAHNHIRAHARAWHIYDDKYRASQKGQVGVTDGLIWYEPLDPNNPEDVAATKRMFALRPGWYLDPILKNGDYNKNVKEQVGMRSQDLGLAKSLRPEFTDTEKEYNKGTFDFIGIVYYQLRKITAVNQTKPFNFPNAMSAELRVDPAWKRSASTPWHYYAAQAFRSALNWFVSEYGNHPMYIIEHGISDETDSLYDTVRSEYLQDQLKELHKAIKLDNCDVRGYFLWSLLDNFPWAGLYPGRFGIYHVDMNHPDRRRTPKMSVGLYQQIIRKNGFAELVPNGCPNMYASGWMIAAMVSFIQLLVYHFKVSY